MAINYQYSEQKYDIKCIIANVGSLCVCMNIRFSVSVGLSCLAPATLGCYVFNLTKEKGMRRHYFNASGDTWLRQYTVYYKSTCLFWSEREYEAIKGEDVVFKVLYSVAWLEGGWFVRKGA